MELPEKLGKYLKGRRKGQAVMEYLITYGLALFVILIVLAILVAVVLPQLKAPESCQFSQPGFSCSTKQDVIFDNTSNGNVTTVIIQLDNQQGRDITLLGVACSSKPPGNLADSDVTNNPPPQLVQPMQMNAGSSEQFELECMDANNYMVTLTPGATFSGSIGVVYNYVDEVSGAPPRLAVATLTGTVQSG
jgi:hypothetical protein